MKILKSTDSWEFVQYPDEMKALGVMCALATLTANYGGEQVFPFVERCHAHIDRKAYGILQLKGKADAPVSVPVAFVLWAKLSKPMEIIYAERFRPLAPGELHSGPNLWVTDIAAPLGHAKQAIEGLWAANPTQEAYKCTRFRDGKWRVMQYTKPAKAKE